MIQDLWYAFPTSLEEKINRLLHQAEPTPLKSYHLYKACQSEDLWQQSFEDFCDKIASFFSTPSQKRKKSDLDRLLDRPLPKYLYSEFSLDFGNAMIDSFALAEIASWAHHLMRVRLKKDSLAISYQALQESLHKLTHPQPHEKVFSISFSDFCSVWRKTVHFLFGPNEEKISSAIIEELQGIYSSQRALENTPVAGASHRPKIYLTQTEIDWVEDILKAIDTQSAPPTFPLSRGPEKQRLRELARTLQLFKIVQTTKLPELLEHKFKITSTLISQCQKLLQDCAR